jgi:hypothetical protein
MPLSANRRKNLRTFRDIASGYVYLVMVILAFIVFLGIMVICQRFLFGLA